MVLQSFIENHLGLVHEVRGVELESVTYFAQEVEDVGEGKPFVGSDFFVVEVEESAQFEVRLVFSLVDFEVDQVFRGLYSDI